LIGEGCHFIDLMIHLAGAIPTHVQCLALPDNNIYMNDNFTVLMTFADGSIGQVTYLSNGSKSLGKEYLEIFSGGKSIIMDDFRKLSVFGTQIKRKRSILSQDKGHAALWDAFMHAIIDHGQPPIDYDELIKSTYVTLACKQALKTNKKVDIAEFIGSK